MLEKIWKEKSAKDQRKLPVKVTMYQYQLPKSQNTYFSFTITPILSKPIFLVQASRPIAIKTWRKKSLNYNKVDVLWIGSPNTRLHLRIILKRMFYFIQGGTTLANPSLSLGCPPSAPQKYMDLGGGGAVQVSRSAKVAKDLPLH